ncbi:ac98235e-6222-4b17-be56-245bc045ca71-CDS [Sclerotinia trifoliorum]|uniref:Aromatic prenyltransferase n=1 Tax=Sclerotinia trifoliorum TaxID=28548 RepID=A0A8H2W2W8_9HELO|nr:ac98235e-6222-4b17-be56-245bc045ca71-CDS [Sclerotinia trifoliorum]
MVVQLVSKSSKFSQSRFLDDIRNLSASIKAPYSEHTTIKVLSVFSRSFHNGVVLWRVTDRPGDALNYRFYSREPIDTVSIAASAGLLSPDIVNTLGKLINSWSSLYDGTPEESCDFDAEKGLVKAWVYMGGMRPLDDILGAEGVPESVRQHEKRFKELGLQKVRHVAVDYQKQTVNLYFRAQGPISFQQATSFNALAGAEPPSQSQFVEMREFLNTVGYTFAVTIKIDSGEIERVGYYALKLPERAAKKWPAINAQLERFVQFAPSYDREEMNAVAWSFGEKKTYVKFERSYCGELIPLIKGWGTTLSS